MNEMQSYSAFAGARRIATGELRAIVLKVKELLERGEADPVLVFDDSSGQQVDFDLRGTPDEALSRLATHPHLGCVDGHAPRVGPGRPRLGVVCREVSLLPRHWEWLERQPQGAAAALRRLVHEARNRDPEGERMRTARDAAAKFMWTMAGNLPAFEEASRALFAGEHQKLQDLMIDWPRDVREHILRMLSTGD